VNHIWPVEKSQPTSNKRTAERRSICLPAALRGGRILSAVYRVTSPTPNGGRQGLALRLMVDPKRRALEVPDIHAATA
jgi:hypothetical protein